MTGKLLVSSHQIGCLLGKGGAVIAEMRKSSGAYIRILGKDQLPICASDNEELVHVRWQHIAHSDRGFCMQDNIKNQPI